VLEYRPGFDYLDTRLDSRNHGDRGDYAASPASQYHKIPWTWPTKTRQSLAYDNSSSDPRMDRVIARNLVRRSYTRSPREGQTAVMVRLKTLRLDSHFGVSAAAKWQR
jgi:hypothetical protein